MAILQESAEMFADKNSIEKHLIDCGYVVVPSDEWIVPLSQRSHLDQLRNSWNNLVGDKYLKNGARFRERRYQRFLLSCSASQDFALEPVIDTTFFQSTEINSYVGGVARQFAPFEEATRDNPLLHALIKGVFNVLPLTEQEQKHSWTVGLHQFRIIGTSDEEGMPAPEGIHRDGHKYISMHLMGRDNVEGGISTIYNDDLVPLVTHQLTAPLDSIIMNDRTFLHGVTPIAPSNPAKPATRDILVIDYF